MANKYNPDVHHRRSIRLRKYDYSRSGAYFITVCTYEKECVLGKIADGKIGLSPVGKVAETFWMEIAGHFDHVELDEFIIMPNHIHGTIILHTPAVGVQNFEPLQLRRHRFQRIIPKSIGSIIRAYKAAVTHWCKNNGHDYFRWQRNYYEHIIRNEDELNGIREYIIGNPYKWESDEENPVNIKPVPKR